MLPAERNKARASEIYRGALQAMCVVDSCISVRTKHTVCKVLSVLHSKVTVLFQVGMCNVI